MQRVPVERWVGLVLASLPLTVWSDDFSSRWQVTPRAEYSRVQVNGIDADWSTAELRVQRALGTRHTLFGLAQQQRRGDQGDRAFQLGAYSRFGQWSTLVFGQYTGSPEFLPEWSFEAQADRPAGRNRRAGLGFRRLEFSDTTIDIWSPYMAFYRGVDELSVSYRVGHNPRLDHDIRIFQLRARLPRGANEYAFYLARGDYIFDALGIAGADGAGWSATVAWVRELNAQFSLRMELGAGRESDSFRQRNIALSLQFIP